MAIWRRNKAESQMQEPKKVSYPSRSVSIHEMRQAIERFTKGLKEGVPLSIIIKEDLTLDYSLLSPFLQAIPKETYYMSRETYELFPEEKRQLALDIDKVQRAVDKYMEITKELPVIDGDPYQKVSYFKLEKLHLLDTRPEENFYITDEEFLITYKKP